MCDFQVEFICTYLFVLFFIEVLLGPYFKDYIDAPALLALKFSL